MTRENYSVLLVEDDSAIAELYGFRLRMDGIRVHIAEDAATAQVIFAKAQPAVVCVDARLRDRSGLGLASELARGGAAVILLTNDQPSYEAPPPGVRLALLKARTTPDQLARHIARLAAGVGVSPSPAPRPPG